MHTKRATITRGASALALILALCGCGGGSGGAPEADPVPTSDVGVADDIFEPEAITVPVDTEVVWTWEGENDHNVVGDDGAFQSPVQDQGTFRWTFDEAGTVAYRCTIHAGMTGTVVVTDGDG